MASGRSASLATWRRQALRRIAAVRKSTLAFVGRLPEDLALRQAADERQGRFANRGDASERLTPPRRQRGRSSGCHDGPTLNGAAGEVNRARDVPAPGV